MISPFFPVTTMQNDVEAENPIAEADLPVWSKTRSGELGPRIENKRVTRNEKVAALAANTALVIAGVIGNPAYGSDSDLYGAMGYVRKSRYFQRSARNRRGLERRRMSVAQSYFISGLTQKSNVTPPTTPPAH